MATANPTVTTDWSLIVSDSAVDFLLSLPFESRLRVDVATTDDVDTPPATGLLGHFLKPGVRQSIDRTELGPGYVFARTQSGAVSLALNAWGDFPLLFSAGTWDTSATWLTDRILG